jgi:hypothetical protein
MQLRAGNRSHRSSRATRGPARAPRVQRLRVCATATVEPATAAVTDGAAFTQRIVEEESQYVLQTYARPNLVFVEGHGAKLYDASGKEYLDMAAGDHARGEGLGTAPAAAVLGWVEVLQRVPMVVRVQGWTCVGGYRSP